MITSALGAADVAFSLLKEGFYIHLNGLGQFVRIIVESVGIVGVGVVVFALILKAITTPFDLYQRIKMRKQNLIMKKLKPELEKLQKQYANDKQTYSMKMYELQKKNGYSLFGACLPMIISLVVIIVAITGFQTYAGYANLSMYEQMAHGYNSVILSYCVQDAQEFHLAREGEEDDGLVISRDTFGSPVPSSGSEDRRRLIDDGVIYDVYTDTSGVERMEIRSASDELFVFYRYVLGEKVENRSYFIDLEKLRTNDTLYGEIMSAGETDEAAACLRYFKDKGAEAAADVFHHQSSPRFLWVKNVWYPDVAYDHPIQDYEKFKSSFNTGIYSPDWEGTKSIAEVIKADEYNDCLTAKLETEKKQANGYFVLIILSIGLMLLSQFITMRSQKETDQYQTVDGQGAMTQKVMMIMMPLMFAVFGFLWSAAFTIYNIISSFLSIVFTLVTNLVMGKIYRKKEEEELKERYTRTAPRKANEGKSKKK